jgi:hypothetical protein
MVSSFNGGFLFFMFSLLLPQFHNEFLPLVLEMSLAVSGIQSLVEILLRVYSRN